MKPKILVIDGTGLIGSKVIDKLKQLGNDAVAAPPATGVYAVTVDGSAGDLAGIDVVVDVAYAPSFEDDAAWNFFQIVGENLAAAEVADTIDFFQTAHENLAAAELAAGVKHHIALSVVGTERLQDGAYFRLQLLQENMIKGSPVPYTIVRATQLFEFIEPIAEAATEGDTVRLAHSLFQPLAAEDLASAVAELALESPMNGTIEIAGPDVFHLDELVAKVLEHDQDPRNVVIDDPGGLFFGIEVDDQSLMPGREARIASTTFDRWLANRRSPQTS